MITTNPIIHTCIYIYIYIYIYTLYIAMCDVCVNTSVYVTMHNGNNTV